MKLGSSKAMTGNKKFLNDQNESWEMNERIVIDPAIQQGKSVIPGTRVPITRILGGLAGAMTQKEIMRE